MKWVVLALQAVGYEGSFGLSELWETRVITKF
jgi:hypothetical protein